jgi:hypothetical protein
MASEIVQQINYELVYSAYLHKSSERPFTDLNFVSTTSQGAQVSRVSIISFRTFCFVTAGIVGALGLVSIIYTATGHGTPDQCAYMIGGMLGVWLPPLLCLAINKLRGKSAGFWTKFFTTWSWLAFLYHDLGPFAIGFMHGFIYVSQQGLH